MPTHPTYRLRLPGDLVIPMPEDDALRVSWELDGEDDPMASAPAPRSRFSTDPAYHVDLLQMLATVMIGLEHPETAYKHEGRSFGIDMVEELPRLFSGDGQARAFLLGYAQSDALPGDLGWNPLYGRSDLAPLIIAEGRRREGQHFEVCYAFARDGTKLLSQEQLYYAYLESPRSVYHAIRLPIWRITEFQTVVATMCFDPGRKEKFIRSRGLLPSDSALVQFGGLGTITLWNYDLPSTDPSRLMTPTHAAWFLNARAVAESAVLGGDPQQAVDVTAWDIDAHAFLSAIPDIAESEPGGVKQGIIRIASSLIDESQLISLLLRHGSRRIAGVSTMDGDLLVDRYYQVAIPPSAAAEQSAPLYRPPQPSFQPDDVHVVCAHERRIPVTSARNLEELEKAIESVRPEDPNGTLLYRGQARHYRLARPESERELLYGTADVDELSLQTTASREFFPYDQFFGRFQLYVQGLLFERVSAEVFNRPIADETRRLIRPFDDDWIETTYRKWRTWYGESIWDLVVMGLAQHYGVPTHGLDLTSSLEVALWFALHSSFEYERQGVRRTWYRPIGAWTPGRGPVLYVLEVSRTLKRHIESAVRDLPIPYPLRVERQEAFLHYGGWGLQSNVCAEDVRLAIYLEPGFTVPDLPSARHLFPCSVHDPFYQAMQRAKQIPFGEALFGRIVDYEDPADGALYQATMMEQFDSARELLRAGAGVHHRDPGAADGGLALGSSDVNRGLTALHWAAFYGVLDLVRRLIEGGADLEATDSNGRRPLVCAAMRGEAHVVEYLLKHGADLRAMDYAGWTMIPSKRRPTDVVDTIHRYAEDRTPLMQTDTDSE